MNRLLPAGWGLLLGLLAIGPGLAPGFVLSYDMVFVPDPAFTEATFGLTGTIARAVPSDAFVIALAQVIPADVVQKLILLAIFVLGCAGAARLVPSDRRLPALAAGTFYMWNPYVGERLLLGQWALLLGYAGLPWAVRAAMDGDTRQQVRALIPAAIGGFAAMAVSAVPVFTIAVVRAAGEPPRRMALAGVKSLAVVGVLSLPWLVPGLLRPGGVPSDPAAADAFAVRADTPFGSAGSLLLLGGTWNAETVPDGYGEFPLVAVWLAVVALGIAGYVVLVRSSPRWRALGIAGLAGFGVACLGLTPVVRWLIELWGGFAILRDGQQYVAPLAVVMAVGIGAGTDRLMGAGSKKAGTDPAGILLGGFAVLAPLVVLPFLAWGGQGSFQAVDYPPDWGRARKIIDGDHAPGDVLVLPWAAYRSYDWNGGRRVLDPMPRFLERRVIWNDAVRVGERQAVAEDPRARKLSPVITSGRPLTGDLRTAGVRYVVVDVPAEKATAAARLPGAELVADGHDLTIYRVPGAGTPPAEANTLWPIVIITWFITVVSIIWSIAPTRQ